MTTLVQTLPRLDPHLVYGVDAAVSFAMGIALIFAATPVTELAGWAMPSTFLWIIGLLLLPWAAYNLWIARTIRPARGAVVANIIGDIAWVAGTVLLVAIHASTLSTLGLALLVGQGIAVSGVLLLKLTGARALT
ncbi:hypothetical protein [Devosia sp. SL43]|uniref:hypothetical protein n=1 Tax=Devosia sp. SL43 TaxID=2806348 RepID=UPI001F403D36|nr:hypothetical protein [Devosia sp. SL43]UJW85813.1 hypothetical protein IM737_00455 [Devosia sp. SL43]